MGGFMVLFVLYWTMHRGIEYLLRRYGQAPYRSAECSSIDGRDRRLLLSTVYMALRGTFGVFITFPSCLYASLTTSWSVNEPLGHAGALCIASQAVPWIGELPFQTEFSTELMLHHLFGVILVCDFVFHPQYIPIRLLYVYLASHLGDGAGVVSKILRNAGHRIQTSRPLWLTTLFQTNVHIWSKAGVAVWTVGKVFQTPYRICDWFFPFCAFFFAVYTLQGAHKSLVYLGITRPSAKGPRGLVVCGRWWFSRFHMTVAAASVSAVVMKPFMYAQALPRRMGAAEHVALWSESFASCALALAIVGIPTRIMLTSSSKTTAGDDKVQARGALYLRLGAMATAGLMYLTSIYEHAGPFKLLDRDLVASWTALTFCVWALVVRLGMWMAVGEECRRLTTDTETKTDLFKHGGDSKQDYHILDDATRGTDVPSPARDLVDARRQLRGVLTDILVLSTPLILKTDYARQGWNHTLMLSHSVSQLIDELVPLLVEKHGVKGKRQVRQILPVLVLLGTGVLLAAHGSVCGRTYRPAMLQTALSVAVLANISGRLLIPTGSHGGANSDDMMMAMTKSTRSRGKQLLSSRFLLALRSRMDLLGSVVLLTVQLVGMWECYGTDSFSRASSRELGNEFKNGKDALASAPAVFGIVVSLLLSTMVAWLVW